MADRTIQDADDVVPWSVGEHRIGRAHTCVRCGKRFDSFDHAITTHCTHNDGGDRG
jgi:hypothetical protein